MRKNALAAEAPPGPGWGAYSAPQTCSWILGRGREGMGKGMGEKMEGRGEKRGKGRDRREGRRGKKGEREKETGKGGGTPVSAPLFRNPGSAPVSITAHIPCIHSSLVNVLCVTDRVVRWKRLSTSSATKTFDGRLRE